MIGKIQNTHTRAQDAGLGKNNWLRVFLSKYFSNRKELHITAYQSLLGKCS
jgi:hypothetical protein